MRHLYTTNCYTGYVTENYLYTKNDSTAHLEEEGEQLGDHWSWHYLPPGLEEGPGEEQAQAGGGQRITLSGIHLSIF